MCEFLQQVGAMFSWSNIAELLNSNFTSALAGALTGAFAGAIAAQKSADRSQRMRQLVEEIRGVNAATTIAFSICSTTLSFKKQQVVDIVAEFQSSRQSFLDHQEQISRGTLPNSEIFHFRANFRDLLVPLLPIDSLRIQVFERVSAPAGALALVAVIAGSIDALVSIMNKRNALIERFREQGEENPHLLPLYFGFPYGDGHLSTEFRDCVDEMNRKTDDVIFFSELLGKDLIEYGEKTLQAYKSLEKKTDLRIFTTDFSDARALGLMPDPSDYMDWLKGFKPDSQQIKTPVKR